MIISRNALIELKFSTVRCAPIYTTHDGLSTQVVVGIPEGLQHESSIHCDAIMSISKSLLTHCTGRLSMQKLTELKYALLAALDLEFDEF